jgi:hypothetical protein
MRNVATLALVVAMVALAMTTLTELREMFSGVINAL